MKFTFTTGDTYIPSDSFSDESSPEVGAIEVGLSSVEGFTVSSDEKLIVTIREQFAPC